MKYRGQLYSIVYGQATTPTIGQKTAVLTKSIQSKNKEVFDIFEGYYVCEDNPNLYIRISRSDKGMYFSMKTIDWEGEEENISFSFDEASFRDSDEPTVIFTGPFNCSSANGIELRYSDDYNTLWRYDDEPVFTRVQD